MYENALELDSLDYQVWGNLASSYMMIPESRDKIISTYRRAIEMAENRRSVNPRDVNLLSTLGEYYAAVADSFKARAYTEQALDGAPGNIDIMVRAGSVFEQIGERQIAIPLIKQALISGYPYIYILQLPELSQLVEDTGIQNILSQIQDST